MGLWVLGLGVFGLGFKGLSKLRVFPNGGLGLAVFAEWSFVRLVHKRVPSMVSRIDLVIILRRTSPKP